ncbi:MAG: polysaccharide biosynthesis tyrosine autokinase [Gemmatimonadetes bacterium]|nr:polysaccharide biosynthesis tyrosine autokinase [Gemmatimonadota bacterium]
MRSEGSNLVPRPRSIPIPWEDARDPERQPSRPSQGTAVPFAGFLRRQKWTILGAAIAVMAAAAVLTLLWPRTYESSATILIQPPGGQAGAEIPGLAILERVERTSTRETEAELIQSRRVVGAAVDSLDLHVEIVAGSETVPANDVFARFEAGPGAEPGEYVLTRSRGDWTVSRDGETLTRGEPGAPVSLAGLSFRLPGADAPGEIRVRVREFPRAIAETRQRVAVSPAARESDILEVTCRGSSPAAAERLCERVSRGYVDLLSDLQRSSAAGTAAFLRDQVEEYEKQLAAAEDSLEAFATAYRGVALGEQATEEVRNFAAFRAQRDQLEAEREALSRMLARAEAGAGARDYRDLASFPSLLQNQGVSQMLAHLADLENRRSELAQRRTELNPELAALDDRIEALDRQLGEMARSYERSLAAQIRSLDQAIGASSGRLSTFPERQVEMARLQRRVDQLGGMYETLQTRHREAEVAEAVHETPVRIVDAASTPMEPSSPRPLLNLALAMVLGLAFGVALAMVRDHGDTRIHDRGELERRTDLPVLALLPRVEPPAAVLPIAPANGDAREGSVRDESGQVLPSLQRRTRAMQRLAARNGGTVALEAFRSLGADLQFVARGVVDGDLRSLAITSAGRGDGKTFVACNFALTRAGFGVHTLLIDADMRGSGVARFFDIEPSPGLSELLSGSAGGGDARRVVKVGQSDLLSVMPAGAPTPDAASLLETSYFEATLAGAEAVYDLVVIDTPPLNVLPDTAAVVANVDAVLVVVREGVTDGRALEFTLERLRRAGCPVVGVVYNGVSLPKQYAYDAYAYAAYGRTQGGES